jgi:two-component system, OmpR family, sensor histidine kinase VanS
MKKGRKGRKGGKLGINLLISAASAFLLSAVTIALIVMIGYFIAHMFKNSNPAATSAKSYLGTSSVISGNVAKSSQLSYSKVLGTGKSRSRNLIDFIAGVFYIEKTTAIILVIFMSVLYFALFLLYFEFFVSGYIRYLVEIGEGIHDIACGHTTVILPDIQNNELTVMAGDLNMIAEKTSQIISSGNETENSKNELITNVAHDLRTPLTAIIGYLELVKDNNLPEETMKKYVDIAYDKSMRMKKLTDDLFTYTKLGLGKVSLNKSEVDVVKLIEQLTDEFYPVFSENRLEVKFEHDTMCMKILADGDLLARMFANLISNAIKYGKEGKNIDIRLIHNEKFLTVSIINYGNIIPKEDIGKLFEKFYRVDESRNGNEGSGLGLAIAKNIADVHLGTISARSDFNGTVFEVKLPIINERLF